VCLQDVFELLSLRRDEWHTGSCTFEVESTIEVHYPVLGPLLGRGHMYFYAF
jgi:hypothetical protein